MRKLTALILLGLILTSLVVAQAPTVPSVPNNEADKLVTPGNIPPGVHELTAADVEAFFDGIVPLQLAHEDIAGVTISMVKDGKPFFAKGYCYANVAQKKPVSPEETLFRPGSVSKLFTWTAVMQL